MESSDTSQAAVLEADEAAQGKGINASSFPADCLQREVHTPTPVQPPSHEGEIGEKGSDRSALLSIRHYGVEVALHSVEKRGKK